MKIGVTFFLAFLTMFVLGGIWNALIMENFYLAHSPSILRPAADFNLPIIALDYVIISALMTLIGAQNFREKPKLSEAFGFGASFGLAVTLPLYLILWGRWDFSIAYGLVDSIWHIIEQGVGALVIFSVYFWKK